MRKQDEQILMQRAGRIRTSFYRGRTSRIDAHERVRALVEEYLPQSEKVSPDLRALNISALVVSIMEPHISGY